MWVGGSVDNGRPLVGCTPTHPLVPVAPRPLAAALNGWGGGVRAVLVYERTGTESRANTGTATNFPSSTFVLKGAHRGTAEFLGPLGGVLVMSR